MKYKNLQVPDFNRIDIKGLTTSEFAILVHHARSREFSPFASFCQTLSGFDLYYKKAKISKWEGFYICKNAEIILMNQSKVEAIKR